ncbi:MAG: ABC transporter ATP-binding protein [Thermodesulfobacteriota bacterium]
MIHVDKLTKYYHDFCAVDHINFDIKKGEILGLLGPNGAGKTTTLKMLTGFFPPTDGNIRVEDYTISDHPLEIKQMIGYLPESSPFYKEMLVYDYLMFVAKIRGIAADRRHDRIRYLAHLCGLEETMHKTVGELSKGLNQRVGLAHAMMNDPEILILDEPTQGLDPNQIAEIRSLIKKIGQEKTVIFSTHILSEAEATCDRIVIINRGKIVADGTTDVLKQGAGHSAVLHLTLRHADLETLRMKLKSIEGVESVEKVEATDDTLSVSVACRTGSDEDLRDAVYEKIKATDWVILEFQQETDTLETVFRDLTEERVH